ncbi:5'-methylthioadenosine/S-adenosylhomocysteine nucleosidase [Streptomyces sp. NPDC047061]|uniref:5'-methylthioadenosine/S-adenosylhomocysteine nucleosidase family protein n=1 Tax=Streptomyces sp. NPDC047061 TaxID=3154605 RepID=UPI0033EB8691
MSATEPIAAFLTALPLEYAAVKALFTDIEEVVHPDGTYADLGRVTGIPWRIALVRTGVGVLNAATVTMRVTDWLRPQAAFFVGVAGGLHDDLEIGDVVVATKVYGIHGGKLKDGRFDVRPAAWPVPYRLDQAAHKALEDRAEFKPVAVGDVVLADDDAELREFLRAHYNDAVAIEMEGTGFAHAAHVSEKLNAMIIRGISDKAGADKGRTDKEGSQRRAAANAARAAVAVLGKLLPVPERGTTEPSPAQTTVHNLGVYRGEHTEFKGTFNAPVIGKVVNHGNPEHGQR